MDYILIAYKLLHSMKNNGTGQIGRMTIKLNMSEAYNQVELPFLEATMKALGFTDKWIQLVISCVILVNYSILLNNRQGLNFTPTRGLLQGDLLSPHLFHFYAK